MLGPRAEEETMLPTRGTVKAGETVTTTGAARLALIRFDVLWVMTRVGTNRVPPPKEKEIASPDATRPIRTPTAPACAARSTLRLTAHTPRSMRATLPEGSARYGSPGQPRPTNATSLLVKPAPIGAQSTVDALAYVPAIEAGE